MEITNTEGAAAARSQLITSGHCQHQQPVADVKDGRGSNPFLRNNQVLPIYRTKLIGVYVQYHGVSVHIRPGRVGPCIEIGLCSKNSHSPHLIGTL